ncbi:SDR family oxidoreductase [Streptomyces sp. GD-15H]|uniref:SDR family oxidoreductase n=1 Tax=Streptomyces sp. GD-15H TaxID=3129112 RepID=UPI003248B0D6
MRLQNKVAIVTGSAQGIGQRYAEMLAHEGAKVVLADIQGDLVAANAEKIRGTGAEAISVAVDLTDPTAVQEMVDTTVSTFGRIDILVNNAALYAGYVHYSMTELPVDYWKKFVDVNVTSVLLTTQAVARVMIGQGRGKIINQSSTAGALSSNVYGLTKLAVQGLTVAFARELSPQGINVNCIGPGITDTQATRDHYPGEKLNEFVDNLHLIKRIATPDDHGWALIYLASDESDMVTGQILRTDAGAFLLPV